MSRNSALNAILPSKCSNSLMYVPNAERIRLVVDNRQHRDIPRPCIVSFLKEARHITRKLEFHYTPKHGSWLNMAECEFAVSLASV